MCMMVHGSLGHCRQDQDAAHCTAALCNPIKLYQTHSDLWQAALAAGQSACAVMQHCSQTLNELRHSWRCRDWAEHMDLARQLVLLHPPSLSPEGGRTGYCCWCTATMRTTLLQPPNTEQPNKAEQDKVYGVGGSCCWCTRAQCFAAGGTAPRLAVNPPAASIPRPGLYVPEQAGSEPQAKRLPATHPASRPGSRPGD